jgi:hypothetical protein
MMLLRFLFLLVLINFTILPQVVLDIPKFRIYPGPITQTEPVAVFHPQNSLIIFSSARTINVSNGFSSEGVYTSTDGGFTWTGNDTCTGQSIINHGGDPGVAIADNGRLILTHIGIQFPGMFSNYSDDMGETWSPSYTITSNQSEDKGTLAADHFTQSNYYGRLYLSWVDIVNLPRSVRTSYSTDNGVSWSQPVQVNPNPPSYSTGTSVAVGSNGIVYLCWAGLTAISPFHEDYIGYAKSTNGGVNWTVNQNIIDMNGITGLLPEKDNIKVNGLPHIGIDNSGGARNGWIYIVTTEKNNAPAGNDPDILIHRSTDSGVSWSQGIRVNQDLLNDGNIQYFPDLNIDDSGNLFILFYDDRNTTSDSTDVFITRSTDGGDSWTEFEIKNSTFKPEPIPGASSGYQGDHIALISSSNQLNALWMAEYTGIYQVWSAVIDKTILGNKEQNYNSPNTFALYQNYPNPFNPATTIRYSVGKESYVSLKIFDSLGREVQALVNNVQRPGEYEVRFKADNLSTGIYFYTLNTGYFQTSRKMLFLK